MNPVLVLVTLGWLAVFAVPPVLLAAWPGHPQPAGPAWTAAAGALAAGAGFAALAGLPAPLWAFALIAFVTVTAILLALAPPVPGKTWLEVLAAAAGDAARAIPQAWAYVRDLVMHPAPDSEPGDELAPRRERGTAPAPALPPADGPAPAGPRFAARSDIPPDHAAAHGRIASFEPDSLSEHVQFLLGEGKSFAGYVDAFGAYADGLIHGPGVPPEAMKPTFDFADMFADVAQMAHLANKKLLDYFAGHLEWAETHEPTRDGRWTTRE